MTRLLLQLQADPVEIPESAEDLQLRNDMERALLATGDRRLRHVCVSVRGNRVTMRGLVPSYYLKQLSQAALMSLTGKRKFRNEVAVLPG